MNARYYDCTTGQFISRDTYLGNAYNPWTQNLYTYTGNNPINYTDPTGHFVNTILGGVMGAISGGVSAALSGGDVWAGIGSGYWSGLIMGAGVDISLATGGMAAVVIAGAIGGATGELLNQLAAGQALDVIKIGFKGGVGVFSNKIGYWFTYAGAGISKGAEIGFESVIDATFKATEWVTTAFLSYVSNVYVSLLDVTSNYTYEGVVAYLQETIDFIERSSKKYQDIYDSIEGEINGPLYGNYKWL